MTDDINPLNPIHFAELSIEAQRRLPLIETLRELGMEPLRHGRGWKCPKCRGNFALAEATAHCWKSECELSRESHGNAFNAIALYKDYLQMSGGEAAIHWLLKAGVIDHATYDRWHPSNRPSNSEGRHRPMPAKPQMPEPPQPTVEDEDWQDGDTIPFSEDPSTTNNDHEDTGNDPQPKKKTTKSKAPKKQTPQKPKAAPATEDEAKILPIEVVAEVTDLTVHKGISKYPNPIAQFADMITLSPDHRRELLRRGFSEKQIDEVSTFRTSRMRNRSALLDLRKSWTEDDLFICGLYRRNKDGSYEPEPQLCGTGNTGKKNADGAYDFRPHVDPILIFYKDGTGTVTSVRPHKGGVKSRQIHVFDDRISSHVYGEHLLAAAPHCRQAIITEGEFKADAFAQCGFPAIAIPGITFTANQFFWKELVDLLRKYRVREIVIIFDNETKEHIEDWEQRWNVQIYSIFLQKKLEGVISFTRIGLLPSEYREADDKGSKIDADGLLKRMVDQHGGDKGTSECAKIFRQTIEESGYPSRYLQHVDAEAAKFISTTVRRKLYQQEVHVGGQEDWKKIRAFRRSWKGVCKEAADRLQAVQGCFYVRKTPPLKTMAKIREQLHGNSKGEIGLYQLAAEETSQWKRHLLLLEAAAIEERLAGEPIAITNFHFKPLYRVWSEAAEEYFYAVQMFSAHGGDHGIHIIQPRNLAQQRDFRAWCLARDVNWGGANAAGQERYLPALTNDLQNLTVRSNVTQLDFYGYHDKSKIVFWRNVAYAADGTRILPDKHQMFWHDGHGYIIGTRLDVSADKKSFIQGRPELRTLPKDIGGEAQLGPFFDKYLLYMRQSYGESAIGAVGIAFAYPFIPLLDAISKTVERPGIWITGQTQNGKTFMTRSMLMPLTGFHQASGDNLSEITMASIPRVLAQYSYLPYWFDEFRHDSRTKEIENLFRGCFDGQGKTKSERESASAVIRSEARTTPIVTGQVGCIDNATLSRYWPMYVSVTERDPQNADQRFEEMVAFSGQLDVFMNYAMSHRPEFEAAFVDEYMQWEEENKHRMEDPRLRKVFGAAFAAVSALSVILPNCQSASTEFRNTFLNICHGLSVEHKLKLNEAEWEQAFWRDIVTGLTRFNGIHHKNFRIINTYMEDGIVRKVPEDHSAQPGIKDETIGYLKIPCTPRHGFLPTEEHDDDDDGEQDPDKPKEIFLHVWEPYIISGCKSNGKRGYARIPDAEVTDGVRNLAHPVTPYLAVTPHHLFSEYETYLRNLGRNPRIRREDLTADVSRKNYFEPVPGNFSIYFSKRGQVRPWLIRMDGSFPLEKEILAALTEASRNTGE